MKKTAVLLYPTYSEYEVSVALSILMQGEKEIVTFGLDKDPISGEAGLKAVSDLTLDELIIEEFDSILLTGCMDVKTLVDHPQYAGFVEKFNDGKKLIAAISSSGYLLARAGILKDKKYTVGLSKEQRSLLGYFDENKYDSALVVRDGHILTARGSGFIAFGIELGRMLGLSFDPAWYGK